MDLRTDDPVEIEPAHYLRRAPGMRTELGPVLKNLVKRGEGTVQQCGDLHWKKIRRWRACILLPEALSPWDSSITAMEEIGKRRETGHFPAKLVPVYGSY